MSFLDDQASGQIEIGGKPTVDTLTRTRRRRKRSQAPMGTETYSLLPQNEFSNIVSTPSDITQVGIGKDLLKQGTAASEVPNVFEQYVSAAPRGSTYEALYGGEDDDEPDDDDIIDELESDPLVIPDADAGVDEPDSPNNPDNFPPNENTGDGVLADLKGFVEGITNIPQAIANKVALATAKPELSEGFFTGIDVAPPTEGNVVDAETAKYEVGQFQAMNPDAPSGISGIGDSGDSGDFGGGGTGFGTADSVGAAAAAGSFASGGTVKAKKSFMSMKGK